MPAVHQQGTARPNPRSSKPLAPWRHWSRRLATDWRRGASAMMAPTEIAIGPAVAPMTDAGSKRIVHGGYRQRALDADTDLALLIEEPGDADDGVEPRFERDRGTSGPPCRAPDRAAPGAAHPHPLEACASAALGETPGPTRHSPASRARCGRCRHPRRLHRQKWHNERCRGLRELVARRLSTRNCEKNCRSRADRGERAAATNMSGYFIRHSDEKFSSQS